MIVVLHFFVGLGVCCCLLLISLTCLCCFSVCVPVWCFALRICVLMI